MGRGAAVRGLGVLSLVLTLTAAGGLASGCGGKGLGSAARAKAPLSAANPCARVHPGAGVKAYQATAANGKTERLRQGSQVVLAERDATVVAYVADEDDGTIHIVDLGSMLELGTLDAGGTPGQMMMTADNRLLVTLRNKAQVKVFEPTDSATFAMEARCSIDTAAEPVGLAMSPDGGTVLVTSGWGHALAAFDGVDLHRRFQVDLPREPRSVVVSDDGSKAYVAHAVGSAMSAVDLVRQGNPVQAIALKGQVGDIELSGVAPSPLIRIGRKSTRAPRVEKSEKAERLSCQGFALAKTVVPDGRVLMPHVLVENGNIEQPSGGYGTSNGAPSEEPNVAVIDEGADATLPASLTLHATPQRVRSERGECLLPRAAAIDPSRGTLLVTCLGIDTLVEYDGTSAAPVTNPLRRWQVASGPTGLAVDWAGRRAVVWSQFDRTLNLIKLPGNNEDLESPSGEPAMRLAVSRRPAAPESADLALGRRLFHATDDGRISFDGRACASCHPDGRDDSITWTTPEGPRQTPMLAGRLEGTAPYSWSGTGETVQAHLEHTFQRLRGRGLEGHELASLIAYIQQMTPPPSHGTTEAARAQLERGAQIFHSSEAECSSCHGKNGAEPDGLKHDVDSRAHADTQSEFDTPSLRFVGGSGPWFHDGRYTSLRALLVTNDGKMGKISHLSPSDMDALEAYVRTL